jgi:hypothetical protein
MLKLGRSIVGDVKFCSTNVFNKINIDQEFLQLICARSKQFLIAIDIFTKVFEALKADISKKTKFLHIICNNKTKTKPAITWKFLPSFSAPVFQDTQKRFLLNYAKKLRKITRKRSLLILEIVPQSTWNLENPPSISTRRAPRRNCRWLISKQHQRGN